MSVQPSKPVVIPLQPSLSSYRMTVQLAGNSYIFDVRWNARDVAWYFDLLAADETPIAYGLKIVTGAFIGRRVKHDLFRLGAFVAVDTAGHFLDAGFDDLGTRVQLRYYTVYDIISAARTASGVG